MSFLGWCAAGCGLLPHGHHLLLIASCLRPWRRGCCWHNAIVKHGLDRRWKKKVKEDDSVVEMTLSTETLNSSRDA